MAWYLELPDAEGGMGGTVIVAIPETDVSFDTVAGHDHDGVNSKAIAGGASTFVALTDTPANFTGASLQYARVNVGETALEFATPAGGGDVTGPAAAVDNAIARFDGVTGKIIQDYTSNPPTITDTGDTTIDGDLTADNVITAGNVDGRDVSVDGSKLDGIAAGADVTGSNAPQAHKDSHDPNDGSDPLDTANAAEISAVIAAGTGTSHSLARADHIHAINHGITDNHILTVDDAAAADDDFARFTASGIEGIPVATAIAALLGAALPENTALILDAALSADGQYSGIVETGTAGATLAFGDLVYYAVADSRWELTDANAEATAFGKLGICVLAAAGDASATAVLLWGKVRADTAFPALTIGAPVYIGTAAGDVQTTAPSGSADIVRIIGYGNTADELYFHPDNTYIEIA